MNGDQLYDKALIDSDGECNYSADNATVIYSKKPKTLEISSLVSNNSQLELDVLDSYSKSSTLSRLVKKLSRSHISRAPSNILLKTPSIEVNKKSSFKRLVKRISNWSLKNETMENVDPIQPQDILPKANKSLKDPNVSSMSRKSILKLRFNKILADEDSKTVRFRLEKKKSFGHRFYNHNKNKLKQSSEDVDNNLHKTNFQPENVLSFIKENTCSQSFIKNSRSSTKNFKYLENLPPTPEDWNILYRFIFSAYCDWEEIERSYNHLVSYPNRAFSDSKIFNENFLPENYNLSSKAIPDFPSEENACTLQDISIPCNNELYELHQQIKWKTR